MRISASNLPTPSLPSPAQILRNARTVAIGAFALAVIANLPQANAGPFGGFLAGVGTAIVGTVMIGAGVVLAPTGVGVGLITAGTIVVAKAPVVGIAVGVSPTP
jgi:hypothetical protein